jgi:hypothetical protein
MNMLQEEKRHMYTKKFYIWHKLKSEIETQKGEIRITAERIEEM